MPHLPAIYQFRLSTLKPDIIRMKTVTYDIQGLTSFSDLPFTG